MAEAAPVSLELKIADNWNLQELLDGLTSQLVGIYLRDDRDRYGIYVLALFNSERRWHPIEAGPMINSSGLIAELLKARDHILATRHDIYGLEVILINFAPPG